MCTTSVRRIINVSVVRFFFKNWTLVLQTFRRNFKNSKSDHKQWQFSKLGPVIILRVFSPASQGLPKRSFNSCAKRTKMADLLKPMLSSSLCLSVSSSLPFQTEIYPDPAYIHSCFAYCIPFFFQEQMNKYCKKSCGVCGDTTPQVESLKGGSYYFKPNHSIELPEYI